MFVGDKSTGLGGDIVCGGGGGAWAMISATVHNEYIGNTVYTLWVVFTI